MELTWMFCRAALFGWKAVGYYFFLICSILALSERFYNEGLLAIPVKVWEGLWRQPTFNLGNLGLVLVGIAVVLTIPAVAGSVLTGAPPEGWMEEF